MENIYRYYVGKKRERQKGREEKGQDFHKSLRKLEAMGLTMSTRICALYFFDPSEKKLFKCCRKYQSKECATLWRTFQLLKNLTFCHLLVLELIVDKLWNHNYIHVNIKNGSDNLKEKIHLLVQYTNSSKYLHLTAWKFCFIIPMWMTNSKALPKKKPNQKAFPVQNKLDCCRWIQRKPYATGTSWHNRNSWSFSRIHRTNSYLGRLINPSCPEA